MLILQLLDKIGFYLCLFQSNHCYGSRRHEPVSHSCSATDYFASRVQVVSRFTYRLVRRFRTGSTNGASVAHVPGHLCLMTSKLRVRASEPTVRKYARMEDLSPEPPRRREPESEVLVPYEETIDSWLDDDRGNWRKQRHTATRVYVRLRDEQS